MMTEEKQKALEDGESVMRRRFSEKGKTAKQHIEAIAQRKDDFITSLQRTLQ